MRKAVKLRFLSPEEVMEIQRLAASNKEPIRKVRRARIIAMMVEDPDLYASEAALRAGFKSNRIGPKWVRRFNNHGLPGLEEQPRPGCKPTHDLEVRNALIHLATQRPESLGYPYDLWTLERLQRAFEERHQVHLSDSTIWEWLDEEGWEWKRQKSWRSIAEDS